LTQLQARASPGSTLWVGAPDCAAPQAAHELAQRGIDLWAIEQNAWVPGHDRDPLVLW